MSFSSSSSSNMNGTINSNTKTLIINPNGNGNTTRNKETSTPNTPTLGMPSTVMQVEAHMNRFSVAVDSSPKQQIKEPHIDALHLDSEITINAPPPSSSRSLPSLHNNHSSIQERNTENQLPKFYLILYDVSKRNNVGTLVRSASAFGVKTIIVVGDRRKDVVFFGAHGSDRRVSFIFVESIQKAVEVAQSRFGCVDICGVEIRDDAFAVGSSNAFRGSTAFLLGNEGTGLSKTAVQVCTRFVYIPHFGGGTASLNVACAGTVVFHRFAEWAGYSEHGREGGKFHVDEVVRNRRSDADWGDDRIREERHAKRVAQANDGELGLNQLQDPNLGLVEEDADEGADADGSDQDTSSPDRGASEPPSITTSTLS